MPGEQFGPAKLIPLCYSANCRVILKKEELGLGIGCGKVVELMAEEPLKRELETFEQHKLELLATAVGKFLLVQGDRIVGAWDTYADAIKAGYQEFGVNTPFLVKQLTRIERIQFFTRNLLPCRS